ncbi:MAG: hypothetical protein RLZZ546_1252 [Bacteroidota bacterium]
MLMQAYAMHRNLLAVYSYHCLSNERHVWEKNRNKGCFSYFYFNASDKDFKATFRCARLVFNKLSNELNNYY